jgi:myo-inositol-1(or 4)-monophosphatase
MKDELAFATRIAREGGEITRGYFSQTDLTVDMKGWADPVTAADRASEAHIRAEMAKHYADDAIHGEEEGLTAGRSGRVWVVDPLDGTANFAGGMPIYAVCITLMAGDPLEPVLNVTYDPIRDEMFEVVKGDGARLNGTPIRAATAEDLAGALIHIAFPRDKRLWLAATELARCVTQVAPHARNIGSSALAQAWVACGRLHAHARVSAGEYDIIGGNLMIEEAGGIVTDLAGGPFGDLHGGLLAAAPTTHRLLLELGMAKCLESSLEDQ